MTVTEKVRAMLVGTGGAAKTRRYAHASMLIVGGRMLPTGCECLLAERTTTTTTSPSSPSSSSWGNARDDDSTTSQKQKQPHQRRRRLVLPQMIPGVVVRAPRCAWDEVLRTHKLPKQFYVCGRARKAAHVARRDVVDDDVRVAPLPCAHAASTLNGCRRCPWMSVGDAISADTKLAVLRSALVSLQHSCTLMEPFIISIHPHQLQELIMTVELPSSSSSSTTMNADDEKMAPAMKHEAESVRMRVWPTTKMDPLHSSSSSSPRVGALMDGDGCLLMTLEQKRLRYSLARWVQKLSTTAQQSIRRIFIHQPRRVPDDDDVRQNNTNNNKSSDVVVVVELQKDVHQWGPQSPLCGPSQPAEHLSSDEQQLVDAVMESAQLIARVVVAVVFAHTSVDGRRVVGVGDADGCGGEVVAEVLYPVCARGVRVMSNSASSVKLAQQQQEEDASQVLRSVSAWCAPLNRTLRARISAWPSTLLHESALLGRTNTDASCTLASNNTNNTFWRHAGALDGACSLLLSLLMDDVGQRLQRTRVAWLESSVMMAEQHGHSRHQHQQRRRATTDEFVTCGVADAMAGHHLLSIALRALMEEVVCDGQPLQIISPTTTTTTSSSLNASAADVVVCMALLNRPSGSLLRDQLHQWLHSSSSPLEVRLVLCECSTSMELHALHETLNFVFANLPTEWHVSDVRASIIDADVLASSFVGYAVLSLQQHR